MYAQKGHPVPEVLAHGAPARRCLCTRKASPTARAAAFPRRRSRVATRRRQAVAHADHAVSPRDEKKGAVKPGADVEDPYMHIAQRQTPPEKATYYLIPTT